MQVKVNTGNGVENHETLERWATQYLQEQRERFARDIMRLEVQLGEESRARNGADDRRCMLEARLTGRQPVAVEHHADSQDAAVRGATQRLLNALDHTLGKQDRREHRDRETIRRVADEGV